MIRTALVSFATVATVALGMASPAGAADGTAPEGVKPPGPPSAGCFLPKPGCLPLPEWPSTKVPQPCFLPQSPPVCQPPLEWPKRKHARIARR